MFLFFYYILTGILVFLFPEYLFAKSGLQNPTGFIWLAQLAAAISGIFGVQFYWAANTPAKYMGFLKLATVAQFLVPIIVLLGVQRLEIPLAVGVSFAILDSSLGLMLLSLLNSLDKD